MANRVCEARELWFGSFFTTTTTTTTGEEEDIKWTAATGYNEGLVHLSNAFDFLAAEGQLHATFRVSALITALSGSERGRLAAGRQHRRIQLEQITARAEAMMNHQEKVEGQKDE